MFSFLFLCCSWNSNCKDANKWHTMKELIVLSRGRFSMIAQDFVQVLHFSLLCIWVWHPWSTVLFIIFYKTTKVEEQLFQGKLQSSSAENKVNSNRKYTNMHRSYTKYDCAVLTYWTLMQYFQLLCLPGLFECLQGQSSLQLCALLVLCLTLIQQVTKAHQAELH